MACNRILNVLESTSAGQLEILDACAAIGKACTNLQDSGLSFMYLTRAKEGYEELLGRDSEKALSATHGLVMFKARGLQDVVEKLKDLAKRCEGALEEENVLTLDVLMDLGNVLRDSGKYEEARKVLWKCLAGRQNLFGEIHSSTCNALMNLGTVYHRLENTEKPLE